MYLYTKARLISKQQGSVKRKSVCGSQVRLKRLQCFQCGEPRLLDTYIGGYSLAASIVCRLNGCLD